MAFDKEIYFEIVTPKSESDSNYEDHEFLLCWFGRNGAFYQYMFYDLETEVRVSGEVVNDRDKDEILTIINSEQRDITLYVEDVSKNDFEVITSLLSTEKIIRLKKDSTYERMAIVPGTYSYMLSDARYNLRFDVRRWNLK